MRLISNPSLIKRYAIIGRYASLVGLVILVGGLLFSIVVPPTRTAQNPALQVVPLATLVVGFLICNLRIYHSDRWVRPPRSDDALDAAPQALHDRHAFHAHRR